MKFLLEQHKYFEKKIKELIYISILSDNLEKISNMCNEYVGVHIFLDDTLRKNIDWKNINIEKRINVLLNQLEHEYMHYISYKTEKDLAEKNRDYYYDIEYESIDEKELINIIEMFKKLKNGNDIDKKTRLEIEKKYPNKKEFLEKYLRRKNMDKFNI